MMRVLKITRNVGNLKLSNIAVPCLELTESQQDY